MTQASPADIGDTNISVLGTIGTGVWQGTVIGPTYGGTGVNNGAFTATLGGNLTTAGAHTLSGAFASTFTFTGATNITFPTSGTLATTTGSVGNILQVISTTKTSSFSTTSTTFTNITALSVTITPSVNTHTILVMVNVNGGNSAGMGAIQILRGATPICIGDASGTSIRATSNSVQYTTNSNSVASMVFLDSPATTAATTYQVQATIGGGGGTFYVNDTGLLTTNIYPVTTSNITVMEIVA